MKLRSIVIPLTCLTLVSALSACKQPIPVSAEPYTIGLLPDTQGGTDSAGQAHVALHPMKQVLQHQADAGVDMVIALGDLTDNGIIRIRASSFYR
jgi:hypothetical protein